jgi:hypothetical protein
VPQLLLIGFSQYLPAAAIVTAMLVLVAVLLPKPSVAVR